MKKVPRHMPGIDIKKLKLDATDGFLLTRIDGKLTPEDLARETGLPDFSVARALEKLEKLGAIEIVDPNAPPPKPPEPEAPKPVAFDVSALPAKYDLKELEDESDIPPEHRKKILDYYYRLDDLDHYMLLGVTKESVKKDIKRSYMALAAVFHPDRYFKKNLGNFKSKLDDVFNRITEAHDTLVDPEKKAEYDAYMAEVAVTKNMEIMFEQAMAVQAKAAANAAATAAANAAAAAPAPEPVPSGPSAAEIAARKAALAARLRAGGRPPVAAAPPKPVEAAPNPLKYANSQDAIDALKRRYEQRIEHATQAHAQRYVQSAEDALAKNDLVSAATSLSIASKFAPEDTELATRAKEVKERADKTLCESYLKQAQYEEKQRHWNEAARSWLKVAKIKDDATSHERAANALLRSDDPDLREAAEHAKRAISLAPNDVGNHVTLIEIYIVAGLSTSAKRAAEAAYTLDPKDERLLALIKRIQDGKG
ncbi:MAG: DnaJ domain-containing protein [Labilithrix sp.]